MTEEIKYEHEHECLCKSKGFRKFLAIALGTFVGGFCAISLFSALHKPMMMGPMGYGYGQYGMFAPYHNCNCPCHKMMKKHHFDKKMMNDKDFKDKIKDQKEEIDD